MQVIAVPASPAPAAALVGAPPKKRARSGKTLEQRWNQQFEALSEFVKEHGHARVPFAWAANPVLGKWVQNQRAAYRSETARKDGRDPSTRGRMTLDRVAKLDSVGFDWMPKLRQPDVIAEAHGGEGGGADIEPAKQPMVSNKPAQPAVRHQKVWAMQFARLKRFTKEHGHTRVPFSWPEDPSLGRWVHAQRESFRGELARREGQSAPTRSRMTPQRIAKLISIGFDWAPAIRTPKGGAIATNGMVASVVAGSKPLSSRPLASTPMLITQPRKRSQRWDDKFVQLQGFIKDHGHSRVPFGWASDTALGRWVHAQREGYRAAQLRATGQKPVTSTHITPERIAQLNSIGFDWVPRRAGGRATVPSTQ